MELVLGIDNIVFIAILSGRLPTRQQPRARRLGLALAHKIVEDHGGTLNFRSVRGLGTAFTVVLPLIPEPPPGAGLGDEAPR